MGFSQWVSHAAYDIVCLQETRVVSDSELNSWFSVYGYIPLASFGTSHSSGTVLLYRPIFTLLDSYFDQQGRLVIAHFPYCNRVFGVVSLYAPNSNPNRDSFF